MSDKKDNAMGEPVLKDEVLKMLGHLIDWARNERIMKFNECLIPGNSELNLEGIKGCPGSTGYLTYLEQSLKHPLGVDTGLVTPEVDAQILDMEQTEITVAIAKYRALLTSLEKDPEAIVEYLHYLQSSLQLRQEFELQDSNEQPTEELQALVRQKNMEITQIIAELKLEISKYSRLLECLEKWMGV